MEGEEKSKQIMIGENDRGVEEGGNIQKKQKEEEGTVRRGEQWVGKGKGEGG